jgi:hypothetical protein
MELYRTFAQRILKLEADELTASVCLHALDDSQEQ